MIVGSDKRYLSKDVFDRTDPPHTDTILLVRLDPKAGDVTVLSVPRDLLVPKFSFQGHDVRQPEDQLRLHRRQPATAVADGRRRPRPRASSSTRSDDIQINDFIDLNFVDLHEGRREARLRLRRRRPPLPRSRRPRPYSGDQPPARATSRSATTARSPTCATATATARSPATPASRTSCARPRSSSASPACSRTTSRS